MSDTLPWDDPDAAPIKVVRKKREGRVKAAGKKYAESKGFTVYAIKAIRVNGFPDMLCVKRGKRALWWEWKKLGKKPRWDQYLRMDELRSTGAVVGWSDNVEDFKDALDRL